MVVGGGARSINRYKSSVAQMFMEITYVAYARPRFRFGLSRALRETPTSGGYSGRFGEGSEGGVGLDVEFWVGVVMEY